MSAQGAMNTALYQRLTGNSGVTSLLAGTASVFHLSPPDGAAFDYVIFGLQGGGNENITPVERKDLVYNVRAISKTSSAKAGSIDAAIYAALHKKNLSVSGWSNFWLVREADFELEERDEAQQKIWTSGGLYRVRLTQ